MSVFNQANYDGHEKVIFHHDSATGLKAIVAIHNTNLGPAIGGCRMWPYTSEEEAVDDVLRLSRGMTYKAAITGLNLGGGKAVIIGESRRDKTPQLMHAMGRFVESLNGEYITAEDVGIDEADVALMSRETSYVTGIDNQGGAGDPSPTTAYGVFRGIEAAVLFRLGSVNLAGMKVAIQGVGKVGYELARLLVEAGADVRIADAYQPSVERAVRELGVVSVPVAEILSQAVDVVAPCAMGGCINANSIGQLQAAIVAGSANNQLSEAADGDRLAGRGVLYVPDYVINAGGLIQVYYQYFGAEAGEVIRHIDSIFKVTLPSIFQIAEARGVSTSTVADQMARDRFKNSTCRRNEAA